MLPRGRSIVYLHVVFQDGHAGEMGCV